MSLTHWIFPMSLKPTDTPVLQRTKKDGTRRTTTPTTNELIIERFHHFQMHPEVQYYHWRVVFLYFWFPVTFQFSHSCLSQVTSISLLSHARGPLVRTHRVWSSPHLLWSRVVLRVNRVVEARTTHRVFSLIKLLCVSRSTPQKLFNTIFCVLYFKWNSW